MTWSYLIHLLFPSQTRAHDSSALAFSNTGAEHLARSIYGDAIGQAHDRAADDAAPRERRAVRARVQVHARAPRLVHLAAAREPARSLCQRGRERRLRQPDLRQQQTLFHHARHAGVHAAGVVIATRPLNELIPLCRVSGGEDAITQWDGPTCEKMGLLLNA